MKESRFALSHYQSTLPLLPSEAHFTEEKCLINSFMDALIKEGSFLKQKSRVYWLKKAIEITSISLMLANLDGIVIRY